MSVNPQLAEMLRKLRDEKGLTQEGLAEATGLSRVQIARLETGERGANLAFETVAKLAKAFGMSSDELFKRINESKKLAKPAKKKKGKGA